jgi:tetratricopeptide (TPR) repeat protein
MIQGQIRPTWKKQLFVAGFSLFFTAFLSQTLLAHESVDLQIEKLSRIIQDHPEDARLLLRRGELNRVLGHWPKALADYAEARRLDPDFSEVDFSEARMMVESGRPQESLPLLSMFLERFPDHVAGLSLRGQAQRALGLHRRAAISFTRAIRTAIVAGRHPAPELFTECAQAWSDTGEKGRDAALKILEEGLALMGSPVTLELVALEIEEEAGLTKAALTRLSRLAAGSRSPAPWLLRRGQILEAAGEPEKAREAFSHALASIEKLPGSKRKVRSMVLMKEQILGALHRLAVEAGNEGSEDLSH